MVPPSYFAYFRIILILLRAILRGAILLSIYTPRYSGLYFRSLLHYSVRISVTF